MYTSIYNIYGVYNPFFMYAYTIPNHPYECTSVCIYLFITYMEYTILFLYMHIYIHMSVYLYVSIYNVYNPSLSEPSYAPCTMYQNIQFNIHKILRIYIYIHAHTKISMHLMFRMPRVKSYIHTHIYINMCTC